MTTVVLFGATGFLGRQVRDLLMADPRVSWLLCPGRADLDVSEPAGHQTVRAAQAPEDEVTIRVFRSHSARVSSVAQARNSSRPSPVIP